MHSNKCEQFLHDVGLKCSLRKFALNDIQIRLRDANAQPSSALLGKSYTRKVGCNKGSESYSEKEGFPKMREEKHASKIICSVKKTKNIILEHLLEKYHKVASKIFPGVQYYFWKRG